MEGVVAGFDGNFQRAHGKHEFVLSGL